MIGLLDIGSRFNRVFCIMICQAINGCLQRRYVWSLLLESLRFILLVGDHAWVCRL